MNWAWIYPSRLSLVNYLHHRRLCDQICRQYIYCKRKYFRTANFLRIKSYGTYLRAFSSYSYADFAGPFLGHMFLILVDAQSKWMDIYTMSSIMTEATIRNLKASFSTHGLPDVLVKDNGPYHLRHTIQHLKVWQKGRCRLSRTP